MQFAAQVVHQYPVPVSMGIAKDILYHLTLLAGELPHPLMEDYFTAILLSLSLLCQMFPPLCSEATEFLVHLAKMCQPLGPSSCSVVGSAGGDIHDIMPLVVAIENTFGKLVSSITA